MTQDPKTPVDAQNLIESARIAFGHQTEDSIQLLALRISQLDRLAKERLIDANTSRVIARRLENERDALRDQLAAARNEALEDAKSVVIGKSDKAREVLKERYNERWAAIICHLDLVVDAIDALKSTTTAPREVNVQEAARVLLDIARERYTENARTRVCQPVEPWDRISDDVKKMWLWASCLRALAKEEQNDA